MLVTCHQNINSNFFGLRAYFIYFKKLIYYTYSLEFIKTIEGFPIRLFYCSLQCCCIIHIYLLFTLVCNGACKIEISCITCPFVSISRSILLFCNSTPLKVMHRDVQRDIDKKTNRRYPKNITIRYFTRYFNQYERQYYCNTRCTNQYNQPY